MESQGIHGTGSTTYTPSEYQIVCDMVRVTCEPITVAQIAASTGLKGNTIRSILSYADGREFVLGGTGNGYMVARSPEDVARLDARLEGQVGAMITRLLRRRRYARNWV